MKPDSWSRVEQVFHLALQIEQGQRAAFLEDTCAGDHDLRSEVEALLAADKNAESFLESPPTELVGNVPGNRSSDAGQGEDRLPGSTISHYCILEKLGGGGMGVVYRAQDLRLNRFVALKFLPAHALHDVSLVEQLRREARAASALNHPHICTVHDIDEQDGRPFIVMELLEGQTLKQRIAAGPVELSEVINLGVQIVEALEAAHARDIIHRDIKPANIFVTPRGQVKVLDFGLAKSVPPETVSALTENTVETRAFVGTLPYMAPEQLAGRGLSPCTDIFAIGTVLYELATGRRPFTDQFAPALAHSILNAQPPKPTELNPAIPQRLESIILKCLEKNPEKRYQRTQDLLADLRGLPGSLGAWWVRSALRRRYIAGAAGFLVVLGILASTLNWAGSSPWKTGARGKTIESLAVLPLQNLSQDLEQEYFSDGMTDALITQLYKASTLRVTSHTSVTRFKGTTKSLPEIAKELNVDAVIEGSVMRSGNRVRIDVKLVQARTEQNLWAETYDRDLGDVLRLQSEVAQSVARRVQMMTPAQQSRLHPIPAVDPQAYEAYLKGHSYLLAPTRASLKQARAYFEEAIRRDPGFALAYVGLGDSYTELGTYRYIAPQDAYRHGSDAIHKALQLDESLGEAHSSLGYLEWQFAWDWQAAEKELRYAVDLNPNYMDGHESLLWYLAWNGQRDEALREIEKIRQLDPVYPILPFETAGVYYHQRDYRSLVEAGQKSVATYPDEWTGHYFLAVGFQGTGRAAEAIPEYRHAVELSQGNTDARAGLAYLYASIGKTPEAEKILRDLQLESQTTYVSPYMIAIIYSGLGRKDKAFEFLEKAYQERSPDLAYFCKADLRLDGLRSDPRFHDLTRRIGFTH